MNTPIRNLRTGGENPATAVRKLSLWLGALGYTDGAISSVFNATLHDAVTQFQRREGLTVDGIFGVRSFERMRERVQQKARYALAQANFADVEIAPAGHAVCPALPMRKGMDNFTFRPDVA